jgi:arylsulfatase
VIFAMGGYASGVNLYAYDGELFYGCSALLIKRDKIRIGSLPAGRAKIEFEMRTPFERAAPAELTFWINGRPAAGGKVQRTIPATFTASETFDVGMDTASPVADADFHRAPFAFHGTIERLHFQDLVDRKQAVNYVPDD